MAMVLLMTTFEATTTEAGQPPVADDSVRVWLRTIPADYARHLPHVTSEVYAVRIEGEEELVTRSDVSEAYETPVFDIRLPEVAARGLYNFVYWHKSPQTQSLPGRNYYNCHWFTALCRGWVQPDDLDPNIIGSGGVYIESRDNIGLVEAGFPAGQAVGVMHDSFQRRFIHTGITLLDTDVRQNPLVISPESWGGPLIIAGLRESVRVYAERYGAIARAFSILDRPRVLGTQNWRVRMARQSGGGADGNMAVASFDSVIRAKRAAHAAFLAKNGIVST